jgi:hypothetical protein
MRRHQLEHVIRAASAITGATEFVAGLLRHRLADASTIQRRLDQTVLTDEARRLSLARLQKVLSSA